MYSLRTGRKWVRLSPDPAHRAGKMMPDAQVPDDARYH
jgi:hypothetical protein